MEFYSKEMAVKVLEYLDQGESYSTEIAYEIGSTTESVGNYLKKLRDSGLIERGRRTKRQYYNITEKGEEYLDKVRNYRETKTRLEREMKEMERDNNGA